jgi:hypothetical protein
LIDIDHVINNLKYKQKEKKKQKNVALLETYSWIELMKLNESQAEQMFIERKFILMSLTVRPDNNVSNLQGYVLFIRAGKYLRKARAI